MAKKVALLFEACAGDEAKKESLLKHLSKNGFSALHFAIYKVSIEALVSVKMSLPFLVRSTDRNERSLSDFKFTKKC